MRSVAPLFLTLSALTVCSTGNTASNDLRIATFNIAMGLPEQGQLGQNLANGQDHRLQQVAEILQRVRADIVVLNEFDYDPDYDAAALFNAHYLAHGRHAQPAIGYPYSYRGPVNTGLDSGLDRNTTFIIAGDFNADPKDSDSLNEDTHENKSPNTAIGQLLALPLINELNEDTHQLNEDTHEPIE